MLSGVLGSSPTLKSDSSDGPGLVRRYLRIYTAKYCGKRRQAFNVITPRLTAALVMHVSLHGPLDDKEVVEGEDTRERGLKESTVSVISLDVGMLRRCCDFFEKLIP